MKTAVLPADGAAFGARERVRSSVYLVLLSFAAIYFVIWPIWRAQFLIEIWPTEGWNAYLQDAANHLLAPLFAWVDNGSEFTSAGYQFNGIFVREAATLSEQSVFIGFTWAVALIAGIRLLTGPIRGALWSPLA